MVIMEAPYRSDKQIERELHDEGLRLVGTEAMMRRFLAKPPFELKYITRREFRMLREQVEETRRIVSIHDDRITSLEMRGKTMRALDNLKSISDRNARQLREMFNLPALIDETQEKVLAEMQGMLSEYSEDELDSVELLHSLRGE